VEGGSIGAFRTRPGEGRIPLSGLQGGPNPASKIKGRQPLREDQESTEIRLQRGRGSARGEKGVGQKQKPKSSKKVIGTKKETGGGGFTRFPWGKG